MSRRMQRPELEFGSDSFLDVVCNIVGILIILIVVVGVKVQRQPAGDPPSAPAATPAGTTDDESAIATMESQVAELTTVRDQLMQKSAQRADDEREAAQELEDLLTQQSLALSAQDAAAAQLAELDEERQKLTITRRTLTAQTAALKQLIDEHDRDALRIGELLTSVTRSEDTATNQLRTAVVETQRLREVLQHSERALEPTDRLQHRLSPVSRQVNEEEIFFRIEHGRISHVPIEELMERLKAQVKSKSSAILRFSQFEGSVGPVGGYRMNYTVEKSGETSLDELIWGDGRISISVRQWTIIPEPTIPDESVTEATQPGSLFRQVIETAPPDQTITMWIYPDSFAGFPALREVAHSLQLRVAARPMPVGTPIVGAPNGSKSTAQ